MRKYIFFLSVILMGACQSSAVFEKYEEQPDEVWNRYHIVEFTADIPDSGQYIVKLCLRHTTDYEMANLWCFVSTRSHGQEQLSDTVNLKIAEPDGRWLGKGNSIKTLEQPINRNPVTLPQGNVIFRIEQGMRMEEMAGVKDVGIKINQIHRKKMAKKKLARFAEMEVLPNVFQPKHEEVFRTDYPLKGKWNEEVFHNDHPIILEIGCGKGEYTVELGKLYPEKNFIGLDIKGARMWKGAKTAVENGMNNVAFLRMYAEMLESVFAPGEIAELWITFPDPQMAKARKRLSGTRFLSLYRKILAPQAVIHLKTDSLFLYRYTSALIELNHLPVEVRTEDLYGCGWEDKILSIKTFYEKQWLSRGKQIKYLRFSLGEDIPLTEPDVEIEKDDYHSETRYMNSHLVHGNKAIRNN